MDLDSSILQRVEGVAARLRKAKHVVVITGAGVSAESGIRTFRDTMEGLWKDFDPAKLATPEAFDADPETVTRWYDLRRLGCLAATPNPGHVALAQLEAFVLGHGGEFTLLTQNVDRLHQRAGSQEVVELHGSIMEWRCNLTGHIFEPPPTPFEKFPPPSPFDSRSILRPDVVWFGEALPEHALVTAFERTQRCDMFFSVGTSSVVYPAAGFVQMAAQNCAFTVEVNKEETLASNAVDVQLQGSSAVVLPELLKRL